MVPVSASRSPRTVTILGSTGSIGRSTIEVIRRLPGFRIVGLAAHRDVVALERQIREVRPKFAAVCDEAAARDLKRRVGRRVEVLAGPRGVVEAAGRPEAGIVVSGMVGSAGLAPTFEAVRRGKRVALANKETLVVGGELVTREAARTGAELVPVDSEHSAIFQCLAGRGAAAVRRLVLTGSGGPFRTRRSLKGVTVRQALRHPTWSMGKKVTIDSATLMNKGLEIIEAHWLFGLAVDSIDVLIHPQSIVHSLVEFVDGSVLAQLGIPDMRLPIQVALTWPERAAVARERLDLSRTGTLTFEPPDERRFPCLAHARAAVKAGGAAPIVLNAANEVAVEAFLSGRIPFRAIPAVIGGALSTLRPRKPGSVEGILEIDREARVVAAGLTARAAA